MTLIKCSECNADISDKAVACPQCGAPNAGITKSAEADSNIETTSQTEDKTKQNNGKTLGIVSICLGVAGLMMPYFAAVYLVPATFICGILVYRSGQKNYALIALVLACLGLWGIVETSNRISTSMDKLNAMSRDFR